MADSFGVSPIAGLYRRSAELIHELAKFGVVGSIGAVLDLGGAAALHGAVGLGPLVAKIISTVVAATFAYAGNRVWTFRHRANAGLAREYLIFFALNGVGLLVALLVIGFTEYSLGMHGQVAYNVAQVTGTGIGTIFRYWAYKKWVFLPAGAPAIDPHTGLPIPAPAPARGGRREASQPPPLARQERNPAVHRPDSGKLVDSRASRAVFTRAR